LRSARPLTLPAPPEGERVKGVSQRFASCRESIFPKIHTRSKTVRAVRDAGEGVRNKDGLPFRTADCSSFEERIGEPCRHPAPGVLEPHSVALFRPYWSLRWAPPVRETFHRQRPYGGPDFSASTVRLGHLPAYTCRLSRFQAIAANGAASVFRPIVRRSFGGRRFHPAIRTVRTAPSWMKQLHDRI
jgi:hypothetical protein